MCDTARHRLRKRGINTTKTAIDHTYSFSTLIFKGHIKGTIPLQISPVPHSKVLAFLPYNRTICACLVLNICVRHVRYQTSVTDKNTVLVDLLLYVTVLNIASPTADTSAVSIFAADPLIIHSVPFI
jgi:hypothetical protein